MQRVAITLVAAGLIGIVLGSWLTYSSVENLFTEVNETADSFEESGEINLGGKFSRNIRG